MTDKLWCFTDNLGSFASENADKIKGLYFPLANEALMSSITPDLHGDIKTGQNSFLLQPVSRIDLENLKSSRNFWFYINKNKVWSATGVSKDLKQIKDDKFSLEAGLLWQKITRENRKIGLKTEILSFVPKDQPVEIMQVTVTNVSRKKIKFIPFAAIPIYARSADNLRDHRHVTSLLQRITLNKFGLLVKPTLVFDEKGHRHNKANYFVLGWEQNSKAPEYIYPTQEMFCGEAGDLEAPLSVLENLKPDNRQRIQGKEAMGALRFKETTLNPKARYSYTIIMGISEGDFNPDTVINKFNSPAKINAAFETCKKYWLNLSEKIKVKTGEPDFDNWFRWVSIQPTLRRIFGCSFLPDFDYGKGGRGWRDLWQDSLGLILNNPKAVRSLLINNFGGVRIDGTNATIIGKNPGEFIPDRNNISRVWMDHGVWPLLTLDLYLNETGDLNILFEMAGYFGSESKGTLLEHLLLQNLVRFFTVGNHNYARLLDADWNDGLDMAGKRGESIAFSCMYAHNLRLVSELLLKIGRKEIKIAKEMGILLRKVDYNKTEAKLSLLNEYFAKAKSGNLKQKISIEVNKLAGDLKLKSDWLTQHIGKDAWLKEGFFNGYYDNQGLAAEGRKKGIIRMMLASQTFPIMSGIASAKQIKTILQSVHKYLLDKKLKGIHLNTDFRQEQYNLGRAFSFIYGDKENGAYFNHMIVMFAYALYSRGFAKEAWQVIKSIYNMSINSRVSKIYPCLPEYFNSEARGMYSYLTGSASWFVLTLLTRVFGIRGKEGDLLIEPKLSQEQFKNSPVISIGRVFADRRVRIIFSNPRRLGFGEYRIIKARLNSNDLHLDYSTQLLIRRKDMLKLSFSKTHTLEIILG
ncbi:MAG: cellobiose phosphorylase [Candidatus Omnitrophota bacterium]